jgi:PAS domain S-box-containing protein
MEAKMEQIPAMNANPVLSVDKNGCVLYSNEAGELLLNEWGVRVGEKVPSLIGDIVHRVISHYSPEKMEIKMENEIYLVIISPLPEQECANISGFDISDQKKFEEKLWESEERFRSAFDNSAVSMALVCPDSRFLKVNDSFCRLLGFEKSEMEGNTFLDFTYPEDIEPSMKTHKAVINRDKPFCWLEKRYICKDGRVIWCDVSSSPVLDSKGCPIYTVAHVHDITERKDAENALKKAHNTLEKKVKERTAELEEAYISLKESEERLSEAQRIANLGNYDYDLVSNKLYWSDELYCIFGLQPQEGMTFNKFLTFIHPDDKDYVNNAVIEAMNGKHYAINYRIVRPDGEVRIVHSKREAIFDKMNKPIQAKGTIQDVTEHKKSEEKIQNLANIVESSNDAIVTVSLDGIITSWNKGAEQIFGYASEETLGKKASILERDNLRGEIKRLVEQVRQGKKVKHYESPRLKKDGTIVIISGTLSPVFDTSGKLVAISVIARDITDRKRTEEVMANIEIARKKEIHHRIKNNLQVISSLLDLQAEKFNGKKNIKDSDVLEAFRESQDRVISMALIHEELHKGEDVDTLNFSSYIKELADNLFLIYRLGNEGICLDISIVEDIFFDMDTSVPLGIIINELISNSLKHAFSGRDKGEIRIKLHREENGESRLKGCKNTTYILSVSDNGIGIPEDLDIENLESLGLQLITTLVDQLDGELEFKKDNGIEFIIRFTVIGNNDQELIPGQ